MDFATPKKKDGPHLALAHSCNDEGYPQYLMTHQANVGTKGLLRLMDVGCQDPLIEKLTLWSGMSHDVGKATLPFYCYVGGFDAKYTELWAPHAMYGTLAVFYTLGRDLWPQPQSAVAQEVSDLIRDHWALLYIIAYHHAGFKTTREVFKDLLFQSARFFLNRDEVPDNPTLKWVPPRACPPNEAFVKGVLPHWDGTQTIIYERLLNQILGWAAERHLAWPPPIPLEGRDPFECFFRHRMAMGALTYGDCVDTAEFFGRYWTPGGSLQFVSLRVEEERSKLASQREGGTDPQIITLRNAVFYACSLLDYTENDWLFVLSAETGSAKTLASLGLAGRLGVCQVIFTLPFLALVQQTSKVLSGLGISEEGVLEHVSVPSGDLAVDDANEEGVTLYRNPNDRISPRSDWVHPLIVTTVERLSRVLTGKNRSDCRRMLQLHCRDTLVIIDEADHIPPHKLHVYTCILKKLGCRVLLMTATAESVQITLTENNHPFVDITPRGTLPQTRVLRSVTWEGHTHNNGPDLAEHFQKQVLSVYNTRRWAHAEFERVAHLSHAYLISGNLCPLHRVHLIKEIKQRLKEGLPCVVIATPTIESGVDLDFPVVYRMLSPLSSLIQTMGRCNREGRLPLTGEFIIWKPQDFSCTQKNGKIWDAPDDEYLSRALWVWNLTQSDQPSDDHALKALEPRLAQLQFRGYREKIKAAEKAYRDLQYGCGTEDRLKLDDYCLVPKDDLVSAVVDYEGAHQMLLDGEMPRRNVGLYTVQVRPPKDRGTPKRRPPQKVEITYKGKDEKPSLVWVDLEKYDPRRGIGVDK